jgi:hypothetical protein
MFNRKSLLFILCLTTFINYSQIEKISEGSAEVQLLPSMTSDQCKQKAIDQAKINAIENAFGSVVMEGNSLYTFNKETGNKIEFNQVFNSISDVYVNGEWIKDMEPYTEERVIKNNEIFYKCRVKGLVREIKISAAKFITKPISCEKLTCETDVFKNGQDFYLYFKAPNDGYVTVYADIPSEAATYRLLPYKNDKNNGSYKVKADAEYIFFSTKKPTMNVVSDIDELKWTLTENVSVETNKLFIFYSPEQPIIKPVLKNDKTAKNEKANLDTPLNLKTEDFQRWQQNLRKQNSAIQLITIYITVKP